MDADVKPPADAAAMTPDAFVPTDIHPPLTADDPCRQLAMTFPSPVLMADAAELGPYLFVAYMLDTGTSGVLVYESEMLLNAWPLPGRNPWLYYEHDTVHAVVDGVRYRLTHDLAPVNEMKGPNETGEYWDMAGELTAEGDFGFGWVSTDGIGGLRSSVSLNYAFPSESLDRSIEFQRAAVGFWHERIGEGRDAFVRLVVASMTPMGLYFKTMDVNVATGGATFGDLSQGDDLASTVAQMALVPDGPESVVVVLENGFWPDSQLKYSQFGIGSEPRKLGLRTVSEAALATRGAHARDPVLGMRTFFVEQVWAEDLLSSTWQLVDPRAETPIAVGRVGHAADKRSPGTLLERDGVLMWAGPTIQDGKTPNHPADAIAVCRVEL